MTTSHEHVPGHVHDEACAMAHGDVPAPRGDRRLVAVFASPVALELVHVAAHVGYEVLVLDPDPQRDPGGTRFVTTAAQAGLDARTDVVVTDHDRVELGDVLADVLGFEPRWIGLMGSLRVDPPHLGPLRDRGFDDGQVARVHRPIGLDIGSRSPAEIAVSTVAGLIADRNGRTGGPFAVPEV